MSNTAFIVAVLQQEVLVYSIWACEKPVDENHGRVWNVGREEISVKIS